MRKCLLGVVCSKQFGEDLEKMENEPNEPKPFDRLVKLAQTTGEIEALQRAMTYVSDLIGEGKAIYTSKELEVLVDSLLNDYISVCDRGVSNE